MTSALIHRRELLLMLHRRAKVLQQRVDAFPNFEPNLYRLGELRTLIAFLEGEMKSSVYENITTTSK